MLNIHFEWTGGFLRISKSLKLTEDILSNDESVKLKEFIKNATFFELSSDYPVPPESHDYLCTKLRWNKKNKNIL